MKKRYILPFFLCFTVSFLMGQNRYFDAMFGVVYTPNIVYGKNIGIITGAPALEDLKVDIYTPAGDTKTDRPLVLIAHTGSFLPPLYNGQVTGSRNDSTVTATAAYLTSRGFVVGAYTYRQGWLPTSPDQNVRTSSLLQAAYRAIQDTRTCIRFFKKTVAEDSNPYGVDPSKICVWGIGSGGYLAMGAGSLNDFSEVTLPQFYNTTTLLPYIDSTLLGNIWGTSQAAISVPNYPTYSSNFQLSVNLGGALGDSTWMDGEAIEPAYVGVHCQNDFFAPYYHGAVIVPTTNQFVIYATGTRKAIELANEKGSNKILENVDPLHDPIQVLINAQKSKIVTLPLTQQTITQGTNNFYGFDIPLVYNGKVTPQGSPWEWWDLNTLTQVVQFVNQNRGTNFNADSLHLSGLKTNPDMSAAKGRAYLDTVYSLALPRACAALNLGCTFTNTKEVNKTDVGLRMMPNPASSYVNFTTNTDSPIQSIYIYDLQGRLVKAHTDINSSQFTMLRNQLHGGYYRAQIVLNNKFVSESLILRD